MGKTKKQKNNKDAVVKRVKQSNTFKPHRKKAKPQKKGKGISGALLENVLDRQEQYFGKRKKKAVKRQQNLKSSKVHSKRGQSAFTVLKQSASKKTFQNCESVSEKETEDSGQRGLPRKKRRTDHSGERAGVGQSSVRVASEEGGRETPSVTAQVQKTKNITERRVSKRKRWMKKQTYKALDANKNTGETLNSNKKTGETLNSNKKTGKTSKGNTKTGKLPKGNIKTGELLNLHVTLDKGNKKNKKEEKKKKKKKTQVNQTKETEETKRKTSKDTCTTDGHFKNKGKNKKMAEKESVSVCSTSEKNDPQSVASSIGSKISCPQAVQLDEQVDREEPPEVIDLVDSDSEMSDSHFSVIDLTLNDTESEAVIFEPSPDQGGESMSEVKEATTQEKVLGDLESQTVEEDVTDKPVEGGMGKESMESDKTAEEEVGRQSMVSDLGREKEQRPRALAAFDGQVLLVLRNPGEYCFLGRCFLKCLHGNAEVLGYQVTDLFQAFYSPACSSLLTITTKENQITENEKRTETDSHTKTSSKKSKSSKKQTEVLTEQETVDKLYSDWLLIVADKEKLPRENVTLLLVRRMESNVCDYISTFKAFQKLWDSPVALQQTTDVNSDDLKLTSVGMTFISETEMVSRQHVSYQQLKLIQKWDDILNSDLEPIVIVVGGKNSGKSTLNRYLVNHTLNKLPKLCFLECDIGQTEFTPPGCVSLQIVDTPILGPPFTHQKVSKYCYYYGGLSGADNPNLYMECVRKCLQDYRKLVETSQTQLPLVVNTMGWVEDLGLEILISLIRMTLPSLLVQINFRNVKMNAEPLTPQFINCREGWVGHSRYYRSNDMVNLLGKTKHTHVNLVSTTNIVRCPCRWKPFEFRDLAVISYMSSILSKDSSLSLETPYGVSWNEVAINICSKGVPKGEWIAAINATVVGLAHADLSQARRHSNDEPYILDSTPVCPCIGFGMVRAIDVVKKVIYITTPLSLVDLASVNTIIRGSSNIPQQIFTEQISRETREIPYVTRITSTTASKNVHQRKYIPSKSRKKVQEANV